MINIDQYILDIKGLFNVLQGFRVNTLVLGLVLLFLFPFSCIWLPLSTVCTLFVFHKLRYLPYLPNNKKKLLFCTFDCQENHCIWTLLLLVKCLNAINIVFTTWRLDLSMFTMWSSWKRRPLTCICIPKIRQLMHHSSSNLFLWKCQSRYMSLTYYDLCLITITEGFHQCYFISVECNASHFLEISGSEHSYHNERRAAPTSFVGCEGWFTRLIIGFMSFLFTQSRRYTNNCFHISLSGSCLIVLSTCWNNFYVPVKDA